MEAADPDLPDAAVEHISQMLTLAKSKHQEAMGLLGKPDPNALPRLREVLRLLGEVELLADDATSYVEADVMKAAIRDLHFQQAAVQAAIALVSSPAFARDTATAAKYFSSHMVLQRDQPIVVWGDAVPGSVVPIVFDGESREARTNSKGQWRTVFSPRKASFEPVVLQVGDKTFEDILIGDVFLASGQSNMHWPVQKSDVKKYPHTKYNDRIRLLKMHYLRARAPEGYTDKELARSNSDDFFQGSWERADLKEISDFSAVAWTAGSLIANDQDVPIGLVQVAVGGSALNNWIPQRVLRTHPFTRHIFKGDFFTNPYFLKPHKERGKQALQRAMSPNEPFIIGKSKYRWMASM